MRFSPLLVSTLIKKPLRYFFSLESTPPDVRWDADEKKTNIIIRSANDYNQVASDKKPRIIISRGSFGIGKSGLDNNLAQTPGGIKEVFGKMERTNQVWIEGSAQIIVEAWQEGTCELLVDMVTHFLVWTAPQICDTQGFSHFALPMTVGDCEPTKENREKFSATIQVPYRMEEQWNVTWDSTTFKRMFTTIEPYDSDEPKIEIL